MASTLLPYMVFIPVGEVAGGGGAGDAGSASCDLRATEWGGTPRDGSAPMQGPLTMAGSFTEPLEHGHGKVGLH